MSTFSDELDFNKINYQDPDFDSYLKDRSLFGNNTTYGNRQFKLIMIRSNDPPNSIEILFQNSSKSLTVRTAAMTIYRFDLAKGLY
jgi:hypothetical protein